jgi:hypothetical protein
MGIFGKKKTTPAAVAQSKLMDYDEMIAYFGLPPGTSIRDGAFHQFRIPATTRLLEYKNKAYQSVELVNHSGAVSVVISGKPIGKLNDQALPDVVHVFRHYGTNRVPAVLGHTMKGQWYTITCIDPLWDGSILT